MLSRKLSMSNFYTWEASAIVWALCKASDDGLLLDCKRGRITPAARILQVRVAAFVAEHVPLASK